MNSRHLARELKTIFFGPNQIFQLTAPKHLLVDPPDYRQKVFPHSRIKEFRQDLKPTH